VIAENEHALLARERSRETQQLSVETLSIRPQGDAQAADALATEPCGARLDRVNGLPERMGNGRSPPAVGIRLACAA